MTTVLTVVAWHGSTGNVASRVIVLSRSNSFLFEARFG